MNQRTAKHIPEVYGTRTDVGCVRGHNEDSFAAKSPLFVVADGMGGHEAGEVASEIAIETMLANVPDSVDGMALAALVKKANLAVMRGAEDGTGKPGMGTTMTAAVLIDDELTVAQVGDSRAYLLHQGSLQRITRDHSLVADLVEQGRITEKEAQYHPQRSVITRALGSDPAMEPDIYTLHVEQGDLLMLCSDGLSSMIEDEAIESIMVKSITPQGCCDALVDEALAAGGLDNVTVVVVDPFAVASKEDRKGSSKPHRLRNRLAPVLWAFVFVGILVAAGIGFYAYARSSYYLIAEDGYVDIYQGLPGDVAGLRVSWLYEKTDVSIDRLAPTTADRLKAGISVDSAQEAEQLVENYRQTIGETGTGTTSATDTSGTTTATTTKE